jgi:hypothetical protein
MSKAEILKIVKVIACVIGFGVLGAAMGILAVIIGVTILSHYMPKPGNFDALTWILLSMSVFGILGGYVGYRITRSKDK